MKKLLVLVLLALAALPALAGEISDLLLSSTGTLYTISSEVPEPGTSEASMVLVLTERNGEVTKREIVPASNARGAHLNGLLGYDAESGTLFVFWIQHFGYLYNELFFVARNSEGHWSEPSSFGLPHNSRQNLRIAITRKVADSDGGEPTTGLTVHATWWEFDNRTGHWGAQYLMLPIEDGEVKDGSQLDLNEFLAGNTDLDASQAADPSVIAHPLLTSTAKQDSVILVFANEHTGRLSQVRITPTRGIAAEGRIRIPVGKRELGYRAPMLPVTADAKLDGVFDDRGLSAVYTIDNGILRYAMRHQEGWAEAKSISLDDQVTSNVAVGALQRMVAEQQ
jgi:hypothetical protein